MKKRFLCPILPNPHSPVLLSEEESRHALRVMRLEDGDLVEAIDGKGNWARVMLRTRGVPPQFVWVEPQQSALASPSYSIILEMAVLKGPAMEWTVEKAVELGVETFIPILSDHTVVQVKNKGPDVFRQRWQKIADQALKQCGRLKRMEVLEPISLAELMTQTAKSASTLTHLWCDEVSQMEAPYIMNWLRSSDRPPAPLRILIGPEGGWSHNEREFLNHASQLQRVHLGPLILRAETAAIYSVSIASSIFLCEKNSVA